MKQCILRESKRYPGHIVCARGCGVRIPMAIVKGTKVFSECRKTQKETSPPKPIEGPGTELKKLIAAMGLTESLGCGCEGEAARMNALGPGLCRQQLDAIVSKLEANAKLQSWWSLVRAGAIAASMGIFSIRGLVERAINDANKNHQIAESADPPAQ